MCYTMNQDNINIMARLRYIDLFCGIGGFRIAAEQVFSKENIPAECVFSSDIDPHVRTAYHENFGDYPSGDINKVDANAIPNHDLLFAGFPCQPFSIIGNGMGFEDTRGTLFFTIAKILKTKRPKAFILENVKRLVNHKNGYTMNRIIEALKGLGYFVEYRILNALDYGLPQKRERVLIIGYYKSACFNWPNKQNKRISLSKILESKVDEKFYASEYIRKKRKAMHKSKISPSIWHENKAGNISSYPYSCALRANASYNYLLVDGKRRLTPREMLRLQGFPDSYKIAVPTAEARKQAGNAVPVNLVRAALEALAPAIKQDLIYNRTKPVFTKTIYRNEEVAAFT